MLTLTPVLFARGTRWTICACSDGLSPKLPSKLGRKHRSHYAGHVVSLGPSRISKQIDIGIDASDYSNSCCPQIPFSGMSFIQLTSSETPTLEKNQNGHCSLLRAMHRKIDRPRWAWLWGNECWHFLNELEYVGKGNEAFFSENLNPRYARPLFMKPDHI